MEILKQLKACQDGGRITYFVVYVFFPCPHLQMKAGSAQFHNQICTSFLLSVDFHLGPGSCFVLGFVTEVGLNAAVLPVESSFP